MEIKLLVEGGEMKPGPGLSQKIGPLGLNLGKIISDVNKATASYKGMKVPVILNINTKTKETTVSVLTPPTSELLKKEAGLQLASSQPNKIKVGNLAIEQIINVARIKQKDMLTIDFKAAVKSVLGSCVSLGILVENKDPREIIEEVDKGMHDKLIEKGKVSELKPSQEKLDELAKNFSLIKKKQEALVKELEKKAEEKAAAAAQPATPAAAPKAGEKTESKGGEKK